MAPQTLPKGYLHSEQKGMNTSVLTEEPQHEGMLEEMGLGF